MSGEPGDMLGLRVPFARHLGLRAEFAGDGKSRLVLDIREELTNFAGMGHGGVIMTMLDIAMAVATRGMLDTRGGLMTLDMTTQFLRPAAGRLTAEGTVLKAGRQIVYCEGAVYDEQRQMIAKSVGTFMPRKPPTPDPAAEPDGVQT